jgi:hypothetical protein
VPGSFKGNFLTFGITDIWIGEAKRIMDLKQTALPDKSETAKQLPFPLPEPIYEV